MASAESVRQDIVFPVRIVDNSEDEKKRNLIDFVHESKGVENDIHCLQVLTCACQRKYLLSIKYWNDPLDCF